MTECMTAYTEALSCQNVCTQSLSASLNLEVSVNDLPSHSGLFKIDLLCVFSPVV